MTGVPASTLRAWEQRYGFPSPERTASAYRVYSKADIELIAAVRARCDGGMAPAEAVAEVLEAGATPAPKTPTPTLASATTADLPLVERMLVAAHAPDPTALDEAIRSALMLGSPTTVYEAVLRPSWATLREQWALGDLDSGRARLALEVLNHAARDLMRLGQPGTPTGTVLLAPLPDEDDVIPLVPIAFAAHSRSLRSVLLAPRTSAASIGEAAERLDATLVAIAASEAPPTRRAREVFDDIASRVSPRPWVACGPATDTLRTVIERCGGTVVDGTTLPV